MKKGIKVAALLTAVWIPLGCATTHMQSVSHTTEFQSSRIRKVLVVCVVQTPGSREIFEKEFVKQWKRRDVQADASSEVLPVNIPLDKAGIAPFAKSQGYDSVLVTRLIKRGQIEPDLAYPKSEQIPPVTTQTN